MNQEIEIKYRVLHEGDLRSLERCAHQLFPNAAIKQVDQTNFFFDTIDLCVRSNRFGVRLRKEDDRYLLTLKGPNSEKKSKPSGVTQRLEFEAPVGNNLALELLSGAHNFLWFVEHMDLDDDKMKHTRDYLLESIKKVCALRELAVIGSFTNSRRILPITISDHKLKLEFDRTQFLESEVHYEVELEIPSMEMLKPAEVFLANLFSECGLAPTHTRSKSERFYSFLIRS